MNRLPLGADGPRVSRLCLGTWPLSGLWGGGIEPAVHAVRRAFDLGVNFFDTARAYGDGAAEAALARGLGDLVRTHRSELVIVTKGGLRIQGNSVVRDCDPEVLRSGLVASLSALGTDYVDLFLVHWPDPTIPLAETAGVLAGFVEEGLVRRTGVSNFTAGQMAEFGPAAVAQVPYSLLARGVERDVLPYCRAAGVPVMGWASLAHGLLTGALRPGHTFAPDDWRAYSPVFRGERLAAVATAVDRLAAVAADRGISVAQLALAWVLHQPAGVVPIFGAQEPEHVEDSVRALEVRLDEAELAELGRLVEGAPPVLPDTEPPHRAPAGV
ncbi:MULTISPECIES: aldo/keto reductase [Catenuloplanes]|uniref:Aryl-alcohol dehydrogenase-like predicted oxidoreductase n=1 Tax=Catenuloplanes niger TaxID=587534 RepID=A0AAE3ZUH3_9ACTN|nr:aldo/keto reductase [Catenuloplanes niger]MDR7325217.1 aryl-alcohol dehydrogenase-like predicted oxidoreductase [Catenuloplanes niger]